MQMQRITEKKNQHILNKQFDDELVWLSPYKKDKENNYHECQLNNHDLMRNLDVEQKAFKGFWPSKQPVWDGIALGRSGTLYLFEAKSHFSEIRRSSTPKSGLIRSRIRNVANTVAGLNLTSESDQDVWFKKYYQIANRMVFKEKMQELAKESKQFSKVVLVFLNFVNDLSWGKKMVRKPDDWIKHFDNIFRQ